MSPSAREEYVARMREIYRGLRGPGAKKEKGRILRQVAQTLVRSVSAVEKRLRKRTEGVERPKRGRKATYGQRVIGILAVVWEAAQCPWSVRLKALLRLWMPWIREKFGLTREEERALLKMSSATMDRRLAPLKKQAKTRLYGKTKPGRFLRQNIPIHTEWHEVKGPGSVEIDTVSHSGPNAAGLFARTVNATELFSGWTEPCAILGGAAEQVVEACDEIRGAFPFDWKVLDSDNGEEFINYELDRYCQQRRIQRLRSRPYKKDDQAHIEQKNGTHVRQLIGWHRYDTPEAVAALNDLYRNEWRLLTNLFLPSIKLDYKTRKGSKLKRVYKPPMTPLDRLLDSKQGDLGKLEELRRLRERLNPFELSKAVDRKLERIWRLASTGKITPTPPPHATKMNRPWEWWRLDEDARLAQLPLQADRDFVRFSRYYWRDGFFGTN